MKFEGDTSLVQQKMTGSSAGVARRLAVMNALNLQTDDTLLDAGCGAGHLIKEIGLTVSTHSKAVGLDPSETQLDAARLRCNGLGNAQFLCGMADKIDLANASCDAITSIQTLDYIEDVDATLGELVRLLKPRSRLVNVSVRWDHFKFHGADEKLNDLIDDAWKAHCHHQMLPLELFGRLAKRGVGYIRTESLAFVITQRQQNSSAAYAETTLANYAISQGVDEDKVQAWRSQLAQAEAEGRFGFTSFPVLTVGTKL